MGKCRGAWKSATLHPLPGTCIPSKSSLFLGIGDLHPLYTSPWLVTCARFWGARRRQEGTTKRAQEGIFSGTVPALAHPPFRKPGPNPLPGQPLRFLSDTTPRPVPVPAPLGPIRPHWGQAPGEGEWAGGYEKFEREDINPLVGGRWENIYLCTRRKKVSVCLC